VRPWGLSDSQHHNGKEGRKERRRDGGRKEGGREGRKEGRWEGRKEGRKKKKIIRWSKLSLDANIASKDGKTYFVFKIVFK
jgi:hypothetical protein